MQLSKQTEKEVLQVYDTWLHSYLNGDIATYDSYFDDDYHFIGSTDNEEFLSRKDTTKFFENTAEQLAGKCDLRKETRILEQFGELVFITHVFDAWFLNGTDYSYYGRFRFTNILHENKDGWRFIYQHFSTPDSKTEEGETIGFDKVNAENQELREAIKRRTIELEQKNRELEIETAVERVRVQSMAMHHPDDLDKVNKELLNQLKWLQLPGLTGGTFYLIDEQGWVKAWDLSSPGNMGDPNSYTLQYDFNKYEMMGEPFKILRQTDLNYFVADYPLEKLERAVYELEEINPAVANIVKEALAKGVLTHQWSACARISDGLLGVDLVSPPSEDTKTIVLKIAGAFNQAYQRFLDLQRAEAQAREAQIEAALERVRSRSLAMHKTDELQDVVRVVAEELKNTGVILDTWGAVICTYFQDSKDVLHWTAAEDPANPSIAFLLPYFKDELYDEAWASKNRGDRYFAKVFSFEVKNAFFNHAFEHSDYRQLPDDYKKSILESESHGIAWAWSKNSAIMIPSIQGDLPSDEEKEILIRFAKVFEQSYIRFLDLQKAEAQTREAQIETALERIRSQATSMQRSTDLLDVVVTMRNEFIRLGHEAHYFWHMLWSPDKYEKAMTSGDGTRIGFVMELPRHIHGNIPLLANWEKSDAPYVVYPMDVDAALDYVHKMVSLGDFKNIDPNAPGDDDIRHIGGLTFIMARTTHGEIGYSLPGAVANPPAEDLDILVRFAGAFDLAHRRFLDLQKAEEQAQNIREERDRLEKALHDLRATQKQLIQSEKMASLGELTAGIAHEIQNPLNFVNNFSELSVDLSKELSEELDKGVMDKDLVKHLVNDLNQNQEKINYHGRRAAGIVNGMLQHARTNTGKKEPTDLNALADEYLRLSYHGLRAKDSAFTAKMVTDFDPAVGMVDVIPQDIGRVFLNIINNAFYATQQRTSVGVTRSHPDTIIPYEPTVSISSKKADNGVEFRIKDNGPGIPDDVKAKIFQPFFTTKPTGQGTGLGLSLAYDIVVKGHGGALEVVTKEGEGTTFIVHLPVPKNQNEPL